MQEIKWALEKKCCTDRQADPENNLTGRDNNRVVKKFTQRVANEAKTLDTVSLPQWWAVKNRQPFTHTHTHTHKSNRAM